MVLVPGPWKHREVAANGQRFHLAEVGDPGAPLVLFLHGFPEFWWAWRHQLLPVAEAGFRAVAVDLRGYGASDKPPLGYDGPTLAADVVGLIRALGGSPAVVVGHDVGGLLGWWAATLHPESVRGLVAVSCPHPNRLRAAMYNPRSGQGSAAAYLMRFQVPRADDWALAEDAAELVGYLHDWSADGFPDAETEARARQAMQIPGAAHCALEYFRWLMRSQLRPSGQRFNQRMRRPVSGRVLQLHGALDTCMLPATAQGSGRWVSGDYSWHLVHDAGHFLPEEQPTAVTHLLIDWLTARDPEG